ncbi:FGGY family carbohydrate kinase [uncultured Tateyamaria sp.]|uniref:xylulokinase n=1 Tax=uncultured Tateyamaria sp. TaxID=455651 RepID=UPI00263072C4|nr:FGGY family carbohydrate kinase [uncultured Tateyamaria sp.]
MSQIWISLDVGTTAIKAAAYAQNGVILASASASTDVLRGPDGSAEQDPHDVWTAAASCLKTVSKDIEINRVSSLGVCAQGDGFWPLDHDGAPVGNAILWSDTRTDIASDLAGLRSKGALKAVSLGCNTDLWPGTSVMGWRWLRKADPDRAARVAHIVTCGDWIARQLTGQIATDVSNATIPFLDVQTRHYGAAAKALDCLDALEKLPQPRSAQSVLGYVTEEAATQTGLPVGLPVSVATLDLAAMIVGLGMARAGETMMILGTTAVVNILTDQIAPTSDPMGATVLHPTSSVAIRVLAPSTGAAAFDWFASLHPMSLGSESTDEVATKLNTLVQDIPVGANGVIFLPYLNGERAPFVDPAIRAGFLGMSGATTKGELGRAVMEGTAFSLRHCFVSENGLPTQPVQLTGGGSRNPVWCQIVADVIGQDVLVNPASDLGLWGAAVLGAAAVNGEDAITMANRTSNELTTYSANPERHAAYGPLYQKYVALSEALRSVSIPVQGL